MVKINLFKYFLKQIRYYKKSDINREKNCLQDDTIFNSVSEFEVFKSNHTDTIFIETVISQCKVIIKCIMKLLNRFLHTRNMNH
jgi:hypothetical protein